MKTTHKIINGIECKYCCTCQQLKPLEQFNKDKSKRDGLCCCCKGCKKQHNAEHKEEKATYQKQYRATPMGRALYLLNMYKQSDRKYNRGKGDLTARWIAENIFTKPCAHCGVIGWYVIGCNRIDNTKPHSKDNVEPCCEVCNKRLPRKKA